MKSLRHHLGWLALLGVFACGGGTAFAATGCNEVTTEASPDAGKLEPSRTTTATCESCVASECTASWALCLTDESCLDARRTSCANVGADGGTTSSGAAAYRAFMSCNDAQTCTGSCASDCAQRCANTAAAPAPAACEVPDAASADASTSSASSCASCANSKCGNAKKACGNGTECTAFLACTFTCTSSTCENECGRLHATGRVAAVELATCTQAGCDEECGL
jgi:hypothetical protein